MLAVCVMAIAFAGKYILFWDGSTVVPAPLAAQGLDAPGAIFTPTATLTPVVIVVTATPEVVAVQSFVSAPAVVQLDPTSTPAPQIITEYIYLPGETVTEVVTEVIEVYPTVLPTPALAPGTVKICASVEGATGLYVGGLGIVSGGCQVFNFGVGQTSIQVQVNK